MVDMAAKNPIHKALETAGKVQAANAKLESMSRPKPTLSQTLVTMKHGDHIEVSGDGGSSVHVHYHQHQSYGDNGQPVHGAVTGEYTVTDPSRPGGGFLGEHPHGPYALTPQARRRGASSDSKVWAADKAAQHVSKLLTVPLFRDRRP